MIPIYNDPVRACVVYRTIGCAHVDGFLCNMADCEILQKFSVDKLGEAKMNTVATECECCAGNGFIIEKATL